VIAFWVGPGDSWANIFVGRRTKHNISTHIPDRILLDALIFTVHLLTNNQNVTSKASIAFRKATI
jgi:hypothetical protein